MELQASEHEICDERTTHQKFSTMVINLSLLDESWLSMQIGTQKQKQKQLFWLKSWHLTVIVIWICWILGGKCHVTSIVES